MLGCKGFDIKTSLPSMNFSCSPIQWVKPWTKLTSIQSQKGTVIQSFFSSSKISIFVLIILSGGIFSFDASNSQVIKICLITGMWNVFGEPLGIFGRDGGQNSTHCLMEINFYLLL